MGLAEALASISQPFGKRIVISLSKDKMTKAN